ncbi:MAG: hypothetical protein K2N11_00390 [Mucispirillum sp.]|nr:hypothetical protein [Mucispirillum sp.]
MVNFKLPYIVYPIVTGIAAGYLISAITGSAFMAPKPLPVPRIKKVEKDNLDVNRAAADIIAKNIFLLDVAPAPVNSNADTEAIENGKLIVTKDGAPLNPPPPFKAALIGIIYDEVNHTGIAAINLDNNTLSISLGKTKEGITLVDLSFSFATIEKDKKRYSIVIDNGAVVQSMPKKQAEQTANTGVKVQDSGTNINITVPRDELKNDLKDINKVLQSARVATFYEDGNFVGYRVAMLKPESPLLKLGLKVGDVITRINGSELTNPGALFNMFSQVDDISALNVDMLRNNEKKSLFVEVR